MSKRRKVKVRPLKKVKVEIAGTLVKDFERRLERVERTVGRGPSVGAVGFTWTPPDGDDD